MMNKIFAMALAMLFSMTAFAQRDVTRFMGIPVDGTKSAMIQKLKAKGFKYNQGKDCLEGEFNGGDVKVHVVTYKNKVCRIMVADAKVSGEGDIKVRFNNLVRQFQKNKKYMPQDMEGDFEISDKEDISYEMTVHNKRYEAAYYQQSATGGVDSAEVTEWALEKIQSRYTEQEREAMSEEEELRVKAELVVEYMQEVLSQRSVWFMIDEVFGFYRILMFYDNELNRASGEDL